MLYDALYHCVEELATHVEVAQTGVTPGIFDAAELARLSVRAPALWLAAPILDPTEFTTLDRYEFRIGLTLYCIARDRLGSSRLEKALDDLVEPLLGVIPGRIWGGEPWSTPASPARARAVYATSIDKQGVALWAIEWEQSIRLPRVRS